MKAWAKNRISRALYALLVGVVMVGAGVLGVRLRPYWVARCRGFGADLHSTVLARASLPNANLMWANLQAADLRGADLRGAALDGARLCNADLRHANLQRATLGGECLPMIDLTGADLRGADLRKTLLERHSRSGKHQQAILADARYDAHTRWPTGFNPGAHGAVKVR